MSEDLHAAIARKVRERLRLHLGPNALEMANRGAAIILNSTEADTVADCVLEVLDDLQAALPLTRLIVKDGGSTEITFGSDGVTIVDHEPGEGQQLRGNDA